MYQLLFSRDPDTSSAFSTGQSGRYNNGGGGDGDGDCIDESAGIMDSGGGGGDTYFYGEAFVHQHETQRLLCCRPQVHVALQNATAPTIDPAVRCVLGHSALLQRYGAAIFMQACLRGVCRFPASSLSLLALQLNRRLRPNACVWKQQPSRFCFLFSLRDSAAALRAPLLVVNVRVARRFSQWRPRLMR